MTIRPQGALILCSPLKKEKFITDSDLELVDNELAWGEVVEFSPLFEGVYKKGDIILYPKDSGISQSYNKKPHLFLNGKGHPEGMVWAIIGNVNDKK